jgi:hypothetical protein
MKLDTLIDSLPENERDIFLADFDEYKNALVREKAQVSFMDYIKTMWPGFVSGRHHSLMAKKFEDVGQLLSVGNV